MKLTAFCNTGVGSIHWSHGLSVATASPILISAWWISHMHKHCTITSLPSPPSQTHRYGCTTCTYMPNVSSIYSAQSYSSNWPDITSQPPLPRPAGWRCAPRRHGARPSALMWGFKDNHGEAERRVGGHRAGSIPLRVLGGPQGPTRAQPTTPMSGFVRKRKLTGNSRATSFGAQWSWGFFRSSTASAIHGAGLKLLKTCC